MFGIYPYTSVTPAQREAMESAKVEYVYQSVFDITNNCLLKLSRECLTIELSVQL